MAKNTAKKKKATTNKQQVVWAPGMPFGKWNYILMLLGMIVLAIGYILLSGGGSENPDIFNYEIFNIRRLTIAPITLVLGLSIELAAILVRFKTNEA